MERALEPNPWHAWNLYWQGARGEAIGRMRQAIALYRGKPWQWAVQLGDWLAEAGDKEGALAAYRQALDVEAGG